MHVLENKVILLVGESSEYRQFLHEILAQAGCRVVEASGGFDAFELVKVRRIDAVVSNIAMKDGSGLQLVGDIRRVNHDIPVILLNEPDGQPVTPNVAFHQGASALLDKPVKKEDLLRLLSNQIKYVLDRLHKRKERIKVAARATVKVGSLESTATVLNLSSSGMFVSLEGDYPPVLSTASFHLWLDHPHATYEIQGNAIVRWVRESRMSGLLAGAGLEFASLTADQANILSDFLAKKG